MISAGRFSPGRRRRHSGRWVLSLCVCDCKYYVCQKRKKKKEGEKKIRKNKKLMRNQSKGKIMPFSLMCPKSGQWTAAPVSNVLFLSVSSSNILTCWVRYFSLFFSFIWEEEGRVVRSSDLAIPILKFSYSIANIAPPIVRCSKKEEDKVGALRGKVHARKTYVVRQTFR